MKTDASTPARPEDFSLILGGPLYQMYLRWRLIRPPLDLLERRVIAFIAVTWLPLLVLTLAGGQAFGGATVPFLFDLDVHVRFLVALPLLIGAELIVHQRLRVTVSQFIDRGIIAPEDRPRFFGIIAAAMRLRNTVAIEIALIVVAITFGYWIWRESMSLRVGSWYIAVGPAGEERLTVAGWWYAFISLNLFRFVLLRWYFRLFVWYFFLWRVSRLPLRLNPLHPDRTGGLGFVGASVHALTPVLVAHTVVLAGVIGGRILYEGMKLPAFQLEIVGAVVLLLGIALAPLTCFVLHLGRARREGARQYGLLAARYVDEFREKWMRDRHPEGEPLVGSADIQSLADLANAYDVVREMRVLPFDRQAIVRLAMVIALPYLPLLLTMMSVDALVSQVIGKVLGGSALVARAILRIDEARRRLTLRGRRSGDVDIASLVPRSVAEPRHPPGGSTGS